MSLFIQGLIIFYQALSVLPWGNAGGYPFVQQAFPEPVRVITSISKEVLGRREIGQQYFGPFIIRHLARRQVHQHGPACTIANGM